MTVGVVVVILGAVACCGLTLWTHLDRRNRRRSAQHIQDGRGLPPDVAASLDRARRRAGRSSSGPNDAA